VATYQSECDAYEKFTALMKQAIDCRALFINAGLDIPLPLRRFLDEPVASENSANVAVVPPPKAPPAPPGSKEDWIWVSIREMAATGLVLGILREAGTPMRSRDVRAIVQKLRPEILSGTIANIGTRLKNKEIETTDDGWRLINPEKAPVLFKDFAWGPVTIFIKQEVAAYRREIIKHILSQEIYRSGLQNSQLLALMTNQPGASVPLTKDILKEDINYLSSPEVGIIKRVGGSKKWRLVSSQETG
jgi:hypothetical protein